MPKESPEKIFSQTVYEKMEIAEAEKAKLLLQKEEILKIADIILKDLQGARTQTAVDILKQETETNKKLLEKINEKLRSVEVRIDSLKSIFPENRWKH